MISHYCKPVYHKFRMGINQLIVSHPERVIHRPDSLEMVNVTGSGHKLYIYSFGKIPHSLRNRLLQIIPVASQVICNNKIEIVIGKRSKPVYRLLLRATRQKRKYEQ